MAIHDYDIANNSGAAVRADINAMAQAIVELNSNAVEPTTKFPFMFWADTGTNLLKQRNSGNTAWIVRSFLGSARILSKTAAYTVAVGDICAVINCINTFTLAVTASSTLGSTFWFVVRNNGTGIITIDPNGAETIDGVATITLAPREDITIYTDGSNLFTIGRRRGAIITLGTGSSTVSLNSTAYLGPTEHSSIETRVNFDIPYSGSIRNMYAVSGGDVGVGESFIYTLRKNAADTLLIATTSDASSRSSDTTNVIAVTAGDTLSVKIVTSLNALKTGHMIAFELISV